MEYLSAHKCTVHGCERQKSGKNKVSIHYFPKKEIFGIKCVEMCQSDILNALKYEDVVRKKYFICHRLFAENSCYKTANGYRLINDSLPTINLLIIPVENRLNVEVLHQEENISAAVPCYTEVSEQ